MPKPAHSATTRTTPAKAKGDGSVSLPVVYDRFARRTAIKVRRPHAKRRAIVLGLVQALILVHIALWLASRRFDWFGGYTISPVEPSEAMQTLELGYVNAGFIFFALALLSTLIFGRWFCGWACHIVLLQDLCGWIMRRLGVTPKPFRSRTLVWAPFILALYMFVWPTFKRLALFPLLDAGWPSARAWFQPVAPWNGWSNHLLTDDFWATFPILMAIPTLLICGFGAVYFLGSKGFCTYGCPYGGFFAPLDEFAPGRIRVTDACEGCGHCTAVCTSNVRVHEEVREYGMVVDPGCMKCLDCVSVCPNEALYFGFGKPAARKGEAKNKRPRRQYDLTLGEDLAIVGVFIGILFSLRGMYLGEGDSIPLLMAVGTSGILTFLAWKTWRVLTRPRDIARIQSIKLTWRGRRTLAGWMLTGIMGLMLAVILSNAAAIIFRARGDRLDARLSSLTPELLLAPREVERPGWAVAIAGEAIGHFERALGWRDGGFAPMTSPETAARLARLHLVRAEFDHAARYLERVIELVGPHDRLVSDLARLKLRQGDREEALRYALAMAEAHPDFGHLVQTVVYLFGETRTFEDGIKWLRERIERRPDDLFILVTLAEIIADRPTARDEAFTLVERALALEPTNVALLQRIAGIYFMNGLFEPCERVLRRAARIEPNNPALHVQLASVYMLMGDEQRAAIARRRARELGAPIGPEE